MQYTFNIPPGLVGLLRHAVGGVLRLWWIIYSYIVEGNDEKSEHRCQIFGLVQTTECGYARAAAQVVERFLEGCHRRHGGKTPEQVA